MKILALDVGEKRIGVAQADTSTKIAVPVGYVETGGQEWSELAKLARRYNTNLFVIGLPRSNEGRETAQSQYVRRFAQVLGQHLIGVKVHFQDETLTSVVAEERLKGRSKPYAKGDIDAEAAAIILQDFLEKYRNSLGKLKTAPVRLATGKETTTTPDTPLSPAEEIEAALAAVSATDETKRKEAQTMPKNHKKSKKRRIALIFALLMVLLIGAAVAAAGYYLIKEQRAAERAAYYAAKEAEMAQNAVFDFTIKPGETLAEIRENLITEGYDASEVDAALEADYDYAFLAERPEGATLEGYLFGETKQFYRETPVEEIIDFYLSEMDRAINENDLIARYADQGLSLFEGITLASIVQMEAPTPEMPTVAQVFLTRLNTGIPLGSDVTVSYALDMVDPDRNSTTDNQTALSVDSCYNTRLYAGLPCGPISNPGLEALLAVAEPADSDYLYFLTGDDGLMYYSYTEEEHLENTALYCQDLCQVSL